MEILRLVNQIITPAYLVGGSVRDMILGQAPKDYDFCTPIRPDEIEAAVKKSGKHAYSIGKSFGTIGFRVDGKYVEVTTFRREKYVKNSRHPSVDFVTNLRDDLARRDFTMNAIAVYEKNDELIVEDPFHGRDDISAKIIRAVGIPRERIEEDPLRMLRAVRFASQLDFAIASDLLVAITENAALIYNVSKERWMAELDRLLLGKNVVMGLRYMAETGLLYYIIPEIAVLVSFYQSELPDEGDLWSLTLQSIAHAPFDIERRWAILMQNVSTRAVQVLRGIASLDDKRQAVISAEIIDGISRRLNWSNDRRKVVMVLVLDRSL